MHRAPCDALRPAVKTEDVRQLLQQTGHTAPLDQAAFTEVMATRLQQRAPDEELKRAFGLFDLHGSSRISLADLTAIAQQLQCDIDPSELKVRANSTRLSLAMRFGGEC